MTRREEELAIERLVQTAAIFWPRLTRSELQQAVTEMVRGLTPPSPPALAYDSGAWDVAP